MAESYPDERAYEVVDSGSLTFRQWDEEANRLARGLTGLGVEPGDRVAIHLEPDNALRWLISYPAVHRAGAVAVPLNTRLGPAEAATMLSHAGVAVAIADGERVGQDAASLRGGISRVIDASPRGTGGHDRAVPFEAVLDHDVSPFQVPRNEDDLADILYTSGTTGRPKGVAVRFVNASLVPGAHPSWNGGRWLSASPLFTFAGLAFVYNPMKLGMGGIYLPRFDAGRWLDIVEQRQPVAVFLVPAMAQLLLDHERFAKADLSSIQICAVGSAPLAPVVVERLQESMPDALVSNNYGMTEAGSAYCVMPKGEAVRRPGSVGMPMPPAEVRCVDEQGRDVPRGEIGEVRLKMPGRPREYYGDEEATASTWVDGWLRTGDLGKIDEDGYLYIVGRIKDVIIRGGNNIHATDVEHAILTHQAVAEATVVGVPHPVLGEDLMAFVVLRRGNEADAEDLRRHCLEQLADYKVPRRWRFVASLPRNATGKVLKSELVAEVKEASS